ncbi:MAG: hypothetical protein WBM44_01190 [Waterburya sp.]
MLCNTIAASLSHKADRVIGILDLSEGFLPLDNRPSFRQVSLSLYAQYRAEMLAAALKSQL